MPAWININDRMPVKQTRQYVKIGGRKDLMDYERLESYIGYSNDCFWLDEEVEAPTLKLKFIPPQHHPKSLIGAIQRINRGVYETGCIQTVEKLFGVKRGYKMKKLLKHLEK